MKHGEGKCAFANSCACICTAQYYLSPEVRLMPRMNSFVSSASPPKKKMRCAIISLSCHSPSQRVTIFCWQVASVGEFDPNAMAQPGWRNKRWMPLLRSRPRRELFGSVSRFVHPTGSCFWSTWAPTILWLLGPYHTGQENINQSWGAAVGLRGRFGCT